MVFFTGFIYREPNDVGVISGAHGMSGFPPDLGNPISFYWGR